MSEHRTKRLRAEKDGNTNDKDVSESEGAAEGPRSFGRYQVIRHLASGGMGSVCLAHDGVLQREVAVKSLRPIAGDLGEEFRSRFLVEARCVASLKHPNIVPIYDLGVEGKTPYLVMEVVDGPALSKAIETGILDVRQARMIGIQIANALAEAHKAGIVHRDVKPANILRAGEDTWKLVDFGVAHAPDSSLTGVGDFLGTPTYAAPESLEGESFHSASDVYSLGATMFHVLGGRPPHGRGNAVQVAVRISMEEAPSLGTVRGELPADLIKIVDQCLARDPAARPSAAVLAEQLASSRAELSESSPGASRSLHRSGPGPNGVDAEAHTFLATSRGQSPMGAEASARLVTSPAAMEPRKGTSWGIALLLVGALAGAAILLSSSSEETQSPDTGDGDEQARGALAVKEPGRSSDDTSAPEARAASKTAQEEGAVSLAKIASKTSVGIPIGTPEEAFEGLAKVEKLLARKAMTRAIRSLDRLRKKHPDSAYLPFLQGTLYMQRRYWKDGFSAYRNAIAKDSRYREHPRLIQDGIRALYSKSQPWRGTRFLRESIGSPARPALERAQAEAANPRVKSRVAALLKQLK